MNYVFYDLETSGKNPCWDQILQVGAILVDKNFNSLDVFEHIDPKNENDFLNNICKSLKPDGVAIIGIPSIESQKYASPESKEGHVNCKTGKDFKECMSDYFQHVFLFSMNDEVVHTGFEKMAHYLFVVCTSKR